MKYIKLGDTALSVSAICFGTAGFGDKISRGEAFRLLDAFFDAGGNFIDTANVYCRWISGVENIGEEFIGAWRRERNASGQAVVATKGGHYLFDDPTISRLTERDIRSDLESSLRALGLDCIDFYWLHRDDVKRPVSEIIDLMERLVQEGKIRYYGASNYTLDRVEAARVYAVANHLTGFSAVSNQWSLASVNPGKNLNPDPSLVFMDEASYQWHADRHVPMIPYSSGAFGFFEKMEQNRGCSTDATPTLPKDLILAYDNKRNARIYERLRELKVSYGVSLHALSIAALRTAPFQVIPVASARNQKQLRDITVAGDVEMTENLFEEFGLA
jgi:aryl-alcohol dehydrogenase-like predicted oxidoreductase